MLVYQAPIEIGGRLSSVTRVKPSIVVARFLNIQILRVHSHRLDVAKHGSNWDNILDLRWLLLLLSLSPILIEVDRL